MSNPVFTQEEIAKAPSLKGKFDNVNVRLTPLEKAVAEAQGLLETTGKLKAEAITAKAKFDSLPAGISMPVPIEDVVKDPDSLTNKINEIKGQTKKPVNEVDESLQLEKGGLEAPDLENVVATETGMSNQGVSVELLIKQSKTPIACSHCGFDQRDTYKPPECSEEDKIAFVRHFCSKEGRFFKEYEAFNGQVKITFRTRTQEEVDYVSEYIRKLIKDEKLVGDEAIVAKLNRLYAAISVHIISFSEEIPEKFSRLSDNKTQKALENFDKEIFGTRSEMLCRVIMSSWLEFERLYSWMAARAYDKDFWKAVDGVHS